MILKSIIFTLFLFFSAQLQAQKIVRSFKTDYCTAYPEGNKKLPNRWSHCCVQHDLYYWAGGIKKEQTLVDKQLKKCVKQTGAKFNSFMMFWGVRLGHLSPLKLKQFKWGNAWGNKVRNKKLSSDEIYALIEDLKIHSKMSRDEIEEFYKNLQSRSN